MFAERLLTLKSEALRAIASNCGSSPSGTKAQIVADLYRRAAMRPPAPVDVVSVDLGLKNIGVSKLEAPVGAAKPQLAVWDRWALSDDVRFAYPDISDHALDLATRIGSMFAVAPAHGARAVLIERQRSRSGGGSSVPPHILRINVLEGMLFAALRAKHPEIYLESVEPKVILNYWRAAMDANASVTANEAPKLTTSQQYRLSKQVRTDVTNAWFADPDPPFVLGDGIAHPNDSMPKKGRTKNKTDDLNDSLVQAVTWLTWRTNSETLLAKVSAGDGIPPTLLEAAKLVPTDKN